MNQVPNSAPHQQSHPGRRVTEALAVSPEISAADVKAIAAAGYRSLICNRPDGEGPTQTDYADIEAAAKTHGLEIAWQPVVSSQLSDADGVRFGEIVSALPAPVYAYCRSGTRCIILWALSEAQSRPSSEIITAAAKAGYDLSALVPKLDAIRGGDGAAGTNK